MLIARATHAPNAWNARLTPTPRRYCGPSDEGNDWSSERCQGSGTPHDLSTYKRPQNRPELADGIEHTQSDRTLRLRRVITADPAQLQRNRRVCGCNDAHATKVAPRERVSSRVGRIDNEQYHPSDDSNGIGHGEDDSASSATFFRWSESGFSPSRLQAIRNGRHDDRHGQSNGVRRHGEQLSLSSVYPKRAKTYLCGSVPQTPNDRRQKPTNRAEVDVHGAIHETDDVGAPVEQAVFDGPPIDTRLAPFVGRFGRKTCNGDEDCGGEYKSRKALDCQSADSIIPLIQTTYPKRGSATGL